MRPSHVDDHEVQRAFCGPKFGSKPSLFVRHGGPLWVPDAVGAVDPDHGVLS
ncbi:hypothetical protein GCM10023335_53680 [Streptomyces siamensis]|uniref:Uncharacterized protein n=1 Tax=Streptomyces siamensis TaxID=1274986 RepID=A0ABP9J6B3_9ACTN